MVTVSPKIFGDYEERSGLSTKTLGLASLLECRKTKKAIVTG